MVSRKTLGLNVTAKTKIMGFVLVVLLFGLPIGGYWFVKNYAILYDSHGIVTSAKLTWSDRTKDMSSLPWGGYIAYVDGSAHFKITCSDGTEAIGGIVARGRADDHEVNRDCRVLQTGEENRKNDFWDSR